MSYEEDAAYTEYCQEHIVKPQFYAKVWPDSRIESSDTLKDNEIAKILDIFASTDKLIIDSKGTLYALGQRIQRAKYAHFESFTIRDKRYYNIDEDEIYSESEFYKLAAAINHSSIHSTYMAHCYMDGNDKFDTHNILHGMIVKTDGLFKFMMEHPKKVYQHETTSDGYKKETFKYILFKDITRLSPEIVVAECINGKIVKPRYKQKKLFDMF